MSRGDLSKKLQAVTVSSQISKHLRRKRAKANKERAREGKSHFKPIRNRSGKNNRRDGKKGRLLRNRGSLKKYYREECGGSKSSPA